MIYNVLELYGMCVAWCAMSNHRWHFFLQLRFCTTEQSFYLLLEFPVLHCITEWINTTIDVYHENREIVK